MSCRIGLCSIILYNKDLFGTDDDDERQLRGSYTQTNILL